MSGAALDVHAVLERRGFTLDAALAARPGETLAVMGPSGAGKSTLLAAIAGVLRLPRGHVRVGERIVSDRRSHIAPQRRGVVLLGQDPHLFPHLSARDNIAFGLRARGLDRAHAGAEADEWLWRVGLPGSGPHRPGELSGGQQQRVGLARALATRPAVLLLDEPLTALDPETAGGVRAMLAEQLPAAHTTTVLVTHDAVDAAALAETLVLLEDGRVTQRGTVRDVLTAPATAFGAVVAGLNRVVGAVVDGWWRAGGLALPARGAAAGDAVALFRPGAVRLDTLPDGTGTGALRLAAAPGEWVGRVSRLEQTVAGIRVHTAEPAVAVDLPSDLVAELGLAAGRPVRLRLDVDAVRLLPA